MLTMPVEKELPIKGTSTSSKRQNLGYVQAKFDFQGQDDEDLPFTKGELLEIVKKQEEKEPFMKLENNCFNILA